MPVHPGLEIKVKENKEEEGGKDQIDSSIIQNCTQYFSDDNMDMVFLCLNMMLFIIFVLLYTAYYVYQS